MSKAISRHTWTIREIIYLRENAGKKSPAEMSMELGLSVKQVICQLYWDRRFRVKGESRVWCLN